MKRYLPSRLLQSELMKNSAKMLSGNVIAQAIGILFYPLLTRLYSADDFGLLNLFLSIAGVLTLVSTADYQYAILLPRSDKKAIGALHLGGFISLGVFLLCLISIPFRNSIASVFKTPALGDVYLLLPVFVLFSSAWTLLNYWFTRKKHFGSISRFQVSQVLWNSILKYVFGLGGILRWGLFHSTVLGLTISLSISLRTAWKKWKAALLTINFYQIRMAARRYAKFPSYSLPRSLVNNLSGNMPFFLLTPAFGLMETGYLGMAFTLAHRPIQMIIASVYQTFFQHISERVQNRQSIRSFFTKFVVRTILIVFPSFALLFPFLPRLCELILGSGWAQTGEYIQLMLPYLAVLCLTGSICFIPDIFQRQGGMLAIEVVYFILRAAGLGIGIWQDNIKLSIFLYLLAGLIIFIVQLIWFGRIINTYEKSLTQRK